MTYLKRIEAIGVHESFDIHQNFEPGINVLYGINGSGKTTLMHILANILNGDYIRFSYLKFHSIKVELSDDIEISIDWNLRKGTLVISKIGRRRKIELPAFQIREQDIAIEQNLLKSNFQGCAMPLPTAYFPAFRGMLEGWLHPSDSGGRDLIGTNQENQQTEATYCARKVFGQFTPFFNYPAPQEVEHKLSVELQEARLAVARIDRDVLSRSFSKILVSLLPTEPNFPEEVEEILDQIKTISNKIQKYPLKTISVKSIETEAYDILQSSQSRNPAFKQILVHILDTYRSLLKEILDAQEEAFKGINKYMNSVNQLLKGKSLKIVPSNTESLEKLIRFVFDDGRSNEVQSLSSGERQIITLLYAAHMSAEKLILIDEPEISLHIDWQRNLLSKMSEYIQDRQLIVCTHSPEIAADFNFKELNVVSTDSKTWIDKEFSHEEDFSTNDFWEDESDIKFEDEDLIEKEVFLDD